MNIQIYTPDQESKAPLYLALRYSLGDVILSVVDQDGQPEPRGNLLMINNVSGAIIRCASVDPAFGLPLNKSGQVVIPSEKEKT